MRVANLESISIRLASPEEMLEWSHGEVTKPETINYRTQKSEKDGLFCERIFGPSKDYECYCGKYKRIRYKGVLCDKCGVEVTKASVRRERMGHIKLACPVAHIWFLRGVPSRMGMVAGFSMQQLEKVIYFAAYIITKVDKDAKKLVLEEINKEYKLKLKKLRKSEDKDKKKLIKELSNSRDKAEEEVSSIKLHRVLSELEYNNISLKYGEVFEAETGAEALRKLFAKIDIRTKVEKIDKLAEKVSPVKRRKILARLKLFQEMDKAGVRPEWMFLTVLPVLPPDLRPMVQLDGGRYASSDLNDLYRRVINRNNRLKHLLEINAPEVIVRNEKRMLQEAVDALIDNGMRKGQTTKATTGGRRLLKSLADMLKGKQGRFRQNLLGKRVDYSGRSVIIVGPELKLYQCGLPKKMALELFKPFVVKKVLDQELAYNVRGATKLIETENDEIWAILEEVVKDKLVLLNRAPTLHRLGIQAFHPILVEGEAIRVHPMVCSAYNADFDGDQMAVHVPLSDEAQKEAKEIMLSSKNLLKPATGGPIVTPTKDMILGCYFLTSIKEKVKGEGKVFGSPNEAIMAYEFGEVDLRALVKVRFSGYKISKPKSKDEVPAEFLETSVGRIIFNESFPADFPYYNEEMGDRMMKGAVGEVLDKYSKEEAQEILDGIKTLGFEYSTQSGISWGMDDLIVPPEKEEIIKKALEKVDKIRNYYHMGQLTREERKVNTISIWQQAKSAIEKLIPQTLPADGPVFAIVNSGARGSWSQPVQMTGMKGLVQNAAGDIEELPVKSSFKEGFDVLEYFISTHGARKGTADTALRTATAGYLTRRLVDVSHEVVISEEDCGDSDGLVVSLKEAEDIGQNPIFKLVSRISLEKIVHKDGKNEEARTIVEKGDIIDSAKAQEIIAAGIREVRVRTPLTCRTVRGVCKKCYGWDLGHNKMIELGQAVGVVAAQAIGEPGTQLTMRTFHTGGVAGGADITRGLPRIEEIFEARSPSGKAVLSQVDGKVIKIVSGKVARIVTIKPNEKAAAGKKEKTKPAELKAESMEYKISPKAALWVEKGDKVRKGQQLCEGSLDLKDLFKIAGTEESRKYIIQEIQKIYVGEGVNIHDKHVEVITRQMFSRVKIKDPGDSRFSPGEIIERPSFGEENEALKKSKKKPATAYSVLLGVSKVALNTDSFLSAASFQETSRVLIKASLEGKEDKLRGLKENVIIGKLIPAGTGFRKKK